MIKTARFWVYLLNVTFLILHEIDGAYWQEWELFGEVGSSLTIQSGLTIYLLAHVPILVLLLYGLVALREGKRAGSIISVALSIFLIGHFALHTWGVTQRFDFSISSIVLVVTFALSLVQLSLQVYGILARKVSGHVQR